VIGEPVAGDVEGCRGTVDGAETGAKAIQIDLDEVGVLHEVSLPKVRMKRRAKMFGIGTFCF
jgi:hypothetical protein